MRVPFFPRFQLLRLVVVASLLLAIALTAGPPATHATQTPAPAAAAGDNPVITIGVAAALGLTGVGWPQVNSVQLAVDQVNAAGGVNLGGVTYSLALAVADDGCNAQQAIAAANTLLAAGVVGVVGDSCSVSTLAAAPVYRAANVAMISPSSTSPQVTQQGFDNVFRTVPHDGSPGAALARTFRTRLGLSRSAVIESFWTSPGDGYVATFTALGGAITSRRTVADTSQFTATLTAILAEQPDVIANFYTEPAHAAAGGLFSRIAHNLGMTNVVGWDSDSNNRGVLTAYANAAGAAAANNDYVAMKWRPPEAMPGLPAFVAAYQAAGFANEPNDPGDYGPFAYDAARILIAAIDRADSANPQAVRNAIAATHNFAGVVGVYQGFDAHGDVVPQWGWLERYRNGQWAPLQPNTFLPVVLKK